MKNKTIRFRVTEEEYAKINELSNGCLSSWIMGKLFGGEFPQKPVLSKRELDVAVGLERAIQDKAIAMQKQNPKCQSPGCPSLFTQSFNRNGKEFWLCPSHQP